jgi:hypothetical protein
MRKLLLGLAAFSVFNSTMAQTDTTIRGIQFRPTDSLIVGADANNFNNRSVRVKGVVLIPGTENVTTSEANPNRHVWLRQIGGGPFSTIGFRQLGVTTPTNMVDLQIGDTVEVTGTASEFQGESQIVPTTEVRIVNPYRSGSPRPQATLIPSIGLFNNTIQLNNFVTGEQYEGDYVELRNVRVIAVTHFFASTSRRVAFTIQDANGNRMNVGDRFFAQRLPNCTTSPINVCGSFVPPSVGDEYQAIRGIILHSKNVRGYEIHPFDSSDYVRGKTAPSVINTVNNPIKPTSTQSCLITAQINFGTDSLGRRAEITRAMLYYTRLANNATSVTTYTDSLPLTRLGSGDLFNATIPAQADSSIIAYYISVSNNQNLTTNSPDVRRTELPESPRFYWVYDRALRIADIQRNPFIPSRIDISNAVSGSIGAQVTVSGVVTVDTSFSGRAFFMQDANGRDFGGIMVRVSNESELRSLRKGQTVTVTGIVSEDGQMTYISAANVVIENQPLTVITPLEIPLTELNIGGATINGATNWNLVKEKYEGQLVRIVNPSGNLVVSNPNYLSSHNISPLSNFGEWKVSLDSTDVNGVVLLSGFRSSSNTYVSNYFYPYVNVDTVSRLRVSPIRIRTGLQFASITGVVYHSFGTLKVIPLVDRVNCTTPATPIISGTASICSGDSTRLTSSSPTGNLWSNGSITQSITVTEAGNYSVRVISDTCTSAISEVFSVSILPIPATPIISGDSSLCNGSATRLTSTFPTGNLWSTGDTTQSINVAQAGSYSVRVINGSCTSALSTSFRVVNQGPSSTVINFDTTSNRCLGARLQLTPAGTFAHYYWNTGERTRSIYTRSSGQYSVQVANSDSCFGLPSPPIIIVFDTTWCTVEIYRVGIDSISANVWADYYIWYLDGIELLSSNTLKTIPVQGDGVYTFRAVTGGRMSNGSNPIVITSGKKSLATTFEIYPNPATNKVTVNTTGTGTIEIVNTLGQVVITQPAVGTNEINISKLAMGVYTVRFNGSSKMLVVK